MENGPFIVSFPIKNGGSFHSYVSLPEGILKWLQWLKPYPSVPINAHGRPHLARPTPSAALGKTEPRPGSWGQWRGYDVNDVCKHTYIYVHIYITTIIVIYVYIYITIIVIYMVPPGVRQPPSQCYPPQPPPAITPMGVASRLPPSVKISYAILACWPRATYALHNRMTPCSVHYCL